MSGASSPNGARRRGWIGWMAGGAGASVLLAACGTLSTVSVRDPAFVARTFRGSAGLDDDVERLVSPMVASGHTKGVVAGLRLPDGTTRFYGYGVADETTGRAPDADTLFSVGSVSKGFLAAMVSLHVDRGDLSWDDTLATLMPPDVRLSADARRITLQQLATHTSGLPRQPVTLQTLGYFVEFLFSGDNFYRHFDTEYSLDYLSRFQGPSQVGRQYSNFGYGLLGYVLERRTGRTVDDLLQSEIAEPLGLECTGYDADASACRANRAAPHAGDQPKFVTRGARVPEWKFTHFMRGSAALSSTARDLLRFSAAHLGGPTPMNAVLAGNLQVRYAMAHPAAAVAWVVDDVLGEPVAYQIGFVDGYSCYLGIDLHHGTSVVVLQNSFNWDNSVGHELLVRLRAYDQPLLQQAKG